MLEFEIEPWLRSRLDLGGPLEEAALAPAGPVERINSANSAMDSRANLASLAWGPLVARGLEGTGGIERGTTPPCLPAEGVKFRLGCWPSVMECDPDPDERGAEAGDLASFRGTDDERGREPFRRASSLLRGLIETTGLTAVIDRPDWTCDFYVVLLGML